MPLFTVNGVEHFLQQEWWPFWTWPQNTLFLFRKWPTGPEQRFNVMTREQAMALPTGNSKLPVSWGLPENGVYLNTEANSTPYVSPGWFGVTLNKWVGFRWFANADKSITVEWWQNHDGYPGPMTGSSATFTWQDQELMKKVARTVSIKTLSPADIITIYYSLGVFACSGGTPILVASPFTPEGFVKGRDLRSNGGFHDWDVLTRLYWPNSPLALQAAWKYELGLRKLLYRDRPDLHELSVIDPATGIRAMKPVLIPPEQFPNENGVRCAGLTDAVAKWTGIVVSILTAGLAWYQTLPLTLSTTLVGITSTMDAMSRIKKIKAWYETYVAGVQSALNLTSPGMVDPANPSVPLSPLVPSVPSVPSDPPLSPTTPQPPQSSPAFKLAITAGLGVALWLMLA